MIISVSDIKSITFFFPSERQDLRDDQRWNNALPLAAVSWASVEDAEGKGLLHDTLY